MDTLNQGNLKIDVENFGPIKKAVVDLRPLTVFVGPSNTGKSYLAILLYALHRYFNARTRYTMFGMREKSRLKVFQRSLAKY